MSTDVTVPAIDVDNNTALSTEAMDASGLQFNESESVMTGNISDIFGESVFKTSDTENEYSMFEKFVILEIIMTTVELLISVIAATMMPKWRRNYRNQMLMQLTLARFLKRVIFIFQFLAYYGKIPTTFCVTNVLSFFQFYTDFVIVILVYFFIKHMYNCLIIVIVKINQIKLYKVLICSWIVPVPISIICTSLIVTDLVDKWHVFVVICSVFRWPLIFIGTGLYIVILYRILTDKIRQFASSLAMLTFLICLIINIYLFSKDIIELFCITSFYTMITYVSGFLLNVLVLSLYIMLIVFSCNTVQTSKLDLPDYSLAEAKCENIISIENQDKIGY